MQILYRDLLSIIYFIPWSLVYYFSDCMTLDTIFYYVLHQCFLSYFYLFCTFLCCILKWLGFLKFNDTFITPFRIPSLVVSLCWVLFIFCFKISCYMINSIFYLWISSHENHIYNILSPHPLKQLLLCMVSIEFWWLVVV